VIRTLVVDDDYMAASVHRSYAERVHGFEVVGEAHTGRDAIELARRLRPDLILLDIYLPDISGLDVIQALREPGSPPVDVIAITSAKDVDTLRRAMHGGVIHYLVKPFFFDTFRERLEKYAALRTRLSRVHEADQAEVDRLYGLLRAQGATQLPKGISSPTLALVLQVVGEADGDVSAAEVADLAGISRGTARRYLEFLASTGSVELSLRYGATGRPEHLYRVTAAGERAAGPR
jgi:response regulator of citrate/malate metabolism